jgi:hypothetical protein
MGLFRNRRRPTTSGLASGGVLTTADASDGRPTPLGAERIVAWLTGNDFHYFTDDDGDIGGLWKGRLFFFFLLGEKQEILQIRGQWHRDIALERLQEVLDLCEEWNAERIWPKTYARVRDNGMVNVVAETSTDLEHGATDDQLDQLLNCGLSSANSFFDSVDQLYPDPAAVAP